MFKKVHDFFGSIFIKMSLTERGNNKLSLTNLAVLVCIVKIAVAPAISIVDMGALLLALLNYAHKRTESNKMSKVEKEQTSIQQLEPVKMSVAEIQAKMEEINKICQKVTGIEDVVELVKKQVADQGKVVEEAKSALTANKLAASQKRHQL